LLECPDDPRYQLLDKISTALEKDFLKFEKVGFNIAEIKKLLKSSDQHFYDICKFFVGKSEFNQQVVSYELLTYLVELYPHIMVEFKRTIDEQLQAQMLWIQHAYFNIRVAVMACSSQENAVEAHRRMTQEHELDVSGDSWIQNAKLVYAQKIKGEEPPKHYITLKAAAMKYY
jgi:DNA-binding transcriptional MerR regulator